ncbi:hypothetical protein F511_09063 [Dorcoceras hygrometricum]|uniref:Uncharacterized protein n=1 Tax=Dorcoceras hygrometricum TaxID=472368 RepID=A0A2Z7DFG5_9LAMI|nr:hypothetical protein F511_09063 [Dorcoceras hygrometricum]
MRVRYCRSPSLPGKKQQQYNKEQLPKYKGAKSQLGNEISTTKLENYLHAQLTAESSSFVISPQRTLASETGLTKTKNSEEERRLILGSDDEIVDSEPVVYGNIVGEAAVEVVDDTAEKDVETVVESVDEPVSLLAVVDVLNEGISTIDDVDIIIERVIAKTAQIQTDEGDKDVDKSDVGEKTVEKADELEQWLNLSYEEFHAQQVVQPVVTTSETDEDMETVEEMETEAVEQFADEAMSLEDILMTIPVECPFPYGNVEITPITLGTTFSIPGVHKGDLYKAGLPKIPATDKGKAPLHERDFLRLREQIIDEVEKFFNSCSLKKLANLKIDESYFDKEAPILSWAETDSTRVALNRKMYILAKYREVLIWKFLEARKINFVPSEGSSATDLKVMEMISDLHMFVVEELKVEIVTHGLRWEKTCCSKIFEGRPRDRGAVIYRTNTNTRST